MAKELRKSVRMSSEELEIILKKAKIADITFSEYVREAALNHSIKVVPGIRELHLQVAKIGNNLNQLAILCHQGSIVCPNIDDTREMLSTIYNMLSQISEEVYSGNSKECDY